MTFDKKTDLNRIISDFYRDIDPKVVKDNEYLEQIQRNCVNQVNPFTCYFTVLLGETPEIIWRHNINKHFGVTDLQYEDFFTLIHPAWLPSYINYARIMYQMTRNHPEVGSLEGVSSGVLVPIRHRSGKYYWYHQICVKTVDDGPNMAAHLNYYHQVSAYEELLPTTPSITTAGEPNHLLIKELNSYTLEFLPCFLSDFLSRSQIGFMLQYREIISTWTDKKENQKELLEKIDGIDTIENLNKVKQRIRKKTMAYFQHPLLDSAYGLGVCLNRYFPII